MKTKKEDLQNIRHINSQPLPDSGVRYVMLESDNRDDEVNLFDLWLVIVRRRVLLLSVLLVCFLIGVFFSFMAPVKYGYSSVIEIGSWYNSQTGNLQLFEAPSSVLAKLQHIYIPQETKKLIDATAELSALSLLNAKLDKSSDVIFIDIKATESREQLYTTLINSVIARVKSDHGRISLLKRKALEQSQGRIESRLGALKNAEQLLISQNRQRVNKQLQLESPRQTGAENNAGDLLQIKLAENNHQQQEEREQLESINTQLNNLLVTRAISEPMKSMEPVSRGKRLTLLISLLVGLFLGVLAVFMAEFLQKARVYAAENK